MNNQIPNVMASSVPQIVVTEPSSVSIPTTQNVMSVVRTIEAIPEVSSNGAAIHSRPSKMSLEQAATTTEPSAGCTSGEFVPAQECNECVVSVPEESDSHSGEGAATTATLEPDQDDFRNTDVECCATHGMRFIELYEKVWKALYSAYAIPVWLVLFTLPLSGGIMGALYMYSCPVSQTSVTFMFTIGISLMIVITLRMCIIMHRLITPRTDDWRKTLHTLLLIATLLTVVFFVTESVAFWKMDQTSIAGTMRYCDPRFHTFAFWWNCAMSIVIVPLCIFPA